MNCLRFLIQIIVFFTFLLSFFITSTNSLFAATCTLTTIPDPVVARNKTIMVIIKTAGLVVGNKYWVKLNGELVRDSSQQGGRIGKDIELDIDDTLLIDNLGQNGVIYPDPNATIQQYNPRDYTLTVQDPQTTGTTHCTTKFTAQAASPALSCNITFLNTTFDTRTDIQVQVSGLSDPAKKHRVMLKRGSTLPTVCATASLLANPGVNLNKHEAGTYDLEVKDACYDQWWQVLFNEKTVCKARFIIVPPGASGGGVIGTGLTAFPTLIPPCQLTTDPNKSSTDPTNLAKCRKLDTAVGEIRTDPVGIIRSVFMILMSLSGGIALLFIIYAGYRLMTSRGNTETIQHAKEILTSAIVGLLFIIFSMVLFEILSVDILHIPGIQ